MFFGIFVINRVSILSFFVLIRVSILSVFQTGYLFLNDKQPARMLYECLKEGQGMRGRAAPPHPRIYSDSQMSDINCGPLLLSL